MTIENFSRESVPICRPVLLAVTILLAAPACGSDGGDENPAAAGSGGGNAGGQAGSAGSGGAGGDGTASADSNWTMLGYDAESTYFNRAETKISRESVKDLEVAWTVDLGGPINGAPLQVEGRLYVAAQNTGENTANVCFDLASGEEQWRNSDFLASSTYAYADGTLYIYDFGGIIRALDAETGIQQWELPSGTAAIGFSSPIVSGDLVIVGGSTFQEIVPGVPDFRGFVFAANRHDGTMAWNTYMVPEGATGAALWSSVSIDAAGLVYAGTGNNYTEPATDTSDAIIAMNFSDGVIQWKNQRYEGDVWSRATSSLGNPDYDFGANPVLFEAEVQGEMRQLVAAGQKSGDVHVLLRDEGGAELWQRNISPGSANGAQGIFNNGAWDGKHLLFAGNGATSDAPGGEPSETPQTSVLFALDPATGDIVWEREIPGAVMAPITAANGVGFVGADRHLEAFDTDTGELLFKHSVDATIASAPTVADGRVAFGSGISWSVGTAGSVLTVLELP